MHILIFGIPNLTDIRLQNKAFLIHFQTFKCHMIRLRIVIISQLSSCHAVDNILRILLKLYLIMLYKYLVNSGTNTYAIVLFHYRDHIFAENDNFWIS